MSVSQSSGSGIVSDVLCCNSGTVHQSIARFPVGRSCSRCLALQFRHCPSVSCPISCRTLPVSLFRTTISAPSISESPDFLSDGPVSEVLHCNSGTVHQWIARFPVGRFRFPCSEPLFRHRPSVSCPISCRTVLFPRFCTAIPAPSHSGLSYSLSDMRRHTAPRTAPGLALHSLR